MVNAEKVEVKTPVMLHELDCEREIIQAFKRKQNTHGRTPSNFEVVDTLKDI